MPLVVVGVTLGASISVWLWNNARTGAPMIRLSPVGFAVLAVGLGFMPLLRVTSDLPYVEYLRFAGLALLGAWTFPALLLHQRHISPSGRRLLGACGLALVIAVPNYPSADWGRLLTAMAAVAIVAVAAPARFGVNEWRKSVVVVSKGLCFLVIGMSIVGLTSNVDAAASLRFKGPFVNPNTLAVTLALLLPSATRTAPAARAVLVPAGFSLILLTGSRGGLLAAAVAMLSLNGGLRARRRIVRFTLAGLALLFITISYRDNAQFRRADPDTRQLIWTDLLRGAAASPLVGNGFGTVEQAPLSTETLSKVDAGVVAHSSWIESLYEQGMLGTALWLGVLLTRLRGPSAAQRVQRATLVSGLVSSLFESWMFAFGTGLAVLFWMFVGVTEGSSDSTSADTPPLTVKK